MAANERKAGPATASLAAAIREAQGLRSMTGAELSRTSSVPYTTLRKILKGGQPIDYEELRKLAKALRVPASTLTRRAEELETQHRPPTPATTPPAPARRTGSHPALPAPGDTRQVPSRQGHGHVPSRDRGAGRTRSHGNS